MLKQRIMSAADGHHAMNDNVMSCDRQALSEQLLAQWHGITREELESTHYDRHEVALLIERKGGVSCALVENYLSNLERTLPLLHQA